MTSVKSASESSSRMKDLLGFDPKPWIQLTRVQKYGGALLLFWPFAWSVTMAASVARLSSSALLYHLGYAFVFANLLRSAGCIWNDILDRDFDRQVERTKNRPLASGAVSVQGALIFLFLHLWALVTMLRPLNLFARKIGFIGIFILPGIYPLMKRITYWPQAWLGLAMNVGVPLAWASINGACPTPNLIFYAAAWSWTIWYDTIYAFQDKKDDVNVGIKSTAVLFDQNAKAILSFFGVVLLGCLALTGYLARLHWTFFACSVLGGLLHLVWQLATVNLDDPKSCWKIFTTNGFSFGFIIWAGLALEYACTMYS